MRMGALLGLRGDNALKDCGVAVGLASGLSKPLSSHRPVESPRDFSVLVPMGGLVMELDFFVQCHF